jgi:hypothetical protein
MTVKKWREKGESLRVDRYRCIEGRHLHLVMSAKTKVTKTKTALKQETYKCGVVELGDSVSVSQWQPLTNLSTIGSNNSKSPP